MPSSTISSRIIDELTDINVTGVLGPSQTRGRREHTFHVRFNPESTAGAVMIEASFDEDYGGTWAQQGSTVTFATADTEHTVSVTGSFLALRARISTAITGVGGAVTVVVVATT